MKKSTIWILTVIMAIAFIGLLCMQMLYMHNMMKMRSDQFTETVKRSLYGVSQRLSQDEARYFLEENVSEVSSSPIYPKYFGRQVRPGGVRYSITTSSGLEADLTIKGNPAEITRIKSSNNINSSNINSSYQAITDEFKNRYMQQKTVLDEVIVNIMSQSGARPITERADSATVRRYLREELDTLGLSVPFEFAVVNRSGTTLFNSENYESNASDQYDKVFVQTLFPNDQRDKLVFLKVYFPTFNDYILSSLKLMIPSIAFTMILLIIFVLTIVLVFRQKKLSEMKNDFIKALSGP